MKETLKQMISTQAKAYRDLHSEEKAYAVFLNYLKTLGAIINQFTQEEIEEIFPKPVIIKVSDLVNTDEQGDQLTSSEFTDISNSYSLKDLKEFGWLNDEARRAEILSNHFYKTVVLPSIGNMPLEVKNDIELHSTHILGRCNNPQEWGDDKQGLVYGMVQSGKTASMMTLMGLASAAGYRIIIVLSGDKESLRNQTQKRINEAFDLNHGGYSNDSKNKIRCLTTLRGDYIEVSRNISNGNGLWNINDKDETIIICIKKQIDNIKKLVTHLENIEKACEPGGPLHDFNYSTDFKTLIIDDEADFASQALTEDGTAVHNALCTIREKLKQDCYVAYTATPQACIGANPKKLIGYPNDFIWLLDPHRQSNGETSTYLGLEEFFEKFPNQLIQPLSKLAWPYILKEEGIKRGIYKPGSTELVDDKRLTEVEAEFLNEILENKPSRDLVGLELKLAIADYLIGCSIRWYRHYVKCKNEGFFEGAIPTKREIEAIEQNGKKITQAGYKPFPYHAMMFNLTQINDSQASIIKLINIFWIEIKKEWIETKEKKWKNNSCFSTMFQKQIEKSMRFDASVFSNTELEGFIDVAMQITSELITDKIDYIYLLNSADEGSTLNYESNSPTNRPKKAAIIVGGNILSRGLTIENLSVTVYARSQVMSLGDTNLQMCRWFGHKKPFIDIQSVYMQDHSQELFQRISESDRELRDQFRFHIFNNVPNKCLLLSLYASPLFKTTSPSKLRYRTTADSSYSGVTVDLLQHIKHQDYLKNDDVLNEYITSLKQVITPEWVFNRADLYRDVPVTEFLDTFSNKFYFSDDALNISPKKYIDYIQKWIKSNKTLPKINIAVFGFDEDTKLPRLRARKLLTGASNEFKTEEELKKNALPSLSAFRGGKSAKKHVEEDPNKAYCGDHLIDMPLEFHKKNYDIRNLRRASGSAILIIFYKIRANYVGKIKINGSDKTTPVFFKDGDKLFINVEDKKPLITYSISTPIGGPVFKGIANSKVVEIVEENRKECQEFFDKLNQNQN